MWGSVYIQWLEGREAMTDEFYFEADKTAGMNLSFQTTLTFQTFIKVQIPVSPLISNRCLTSVYYVARTQSETYKQEETMNPNETHPGYSGTDLRFKKPTWEVYDALNLH